MIVVVTTFSPEGYKRYGRRFVATYKEFWPKKIKLRCGYEGDAPFGVKGFNLLETEPCKSFLARYEDDPCVRGKVESPLSPWRKKAKLERYCFRHDAWKFSRKVFATAHVARLMGRGKLFFIDADVETIGNVTEGFLNSVLPDRVSISYLSRGRYHSELGFVGYNLDRAETHKFISAYENRYADGTFYADSCWDDCNQFDFLVKDLRPKVRRIPWAERSQPFDTSELAEYMTHYKGMKKRSSYKRIAKEIPSGCCK